MNYYELLNIPRDADSITVKRAYFSAVKLHSPDSDPEGFKAIRTAYETLSDKKSRIEYDAYFITSDGGEMEAGLQNDLLAARELIKKNKYFQAEIFLTELEGKYPDSSKEAAEVKRLHAEVLWLLKKSGIAEKLCAELLEKYPKDCDTLVLRGKIAASMNKKEKAGAFFKDAVEAAPLNSRAWIEYMRYALKHSHSRIPGIFQSAMEQDQDMFRDEYVLYLAGVHDLDLFNNENYQQYYDKFAEYFINDKNHEEDLYNRLISLIPSFIMKDELIPFVKKILPTLESSRHQTDDDKEYFKNVHETLIFYNLRFDERIHEVLVDLTGFLYSDQKDKNEQLSMECYIAFNLLTLRPSIKILMNEYPNFFKLNQTFYLDALNDKKNDFLLDKYSGIYKKLNPGLKNISGYDDFDDDEEESKPFVRTSVKTGRNDPCPCGSGKKYKKCCG